MGCCADVPCLHQEIILELSWAGQPCSESLQGFGEACLCSRAPWAGAVGVPDAAHLMASSSGSSSASPGSHRWCQAPTADPALPCPHPGWHGEEYSSSCFERYLFPNHV